MAKGSHTTWAGWEPRVCCWCAMTLTHDTGHMCYFDDETGEAWSTCTRPECIRRGRPVASTDGRSGRSTIR